MTGIVIWDDESPAPAREGWTTVLWRGFPPPGSSAVSLTAIVEEQAEELRARFLAWVFEVGETSIAGKAIVDHLEVRPGLSYWWMTPVAHKPNYHEGFFITDVIKCLALEGLDAMRNGTPRVHVRTGNIRLAELFRAYCGERRLAFSADLLPPADAAPGHAPAPHRGRLRRLRDGIPRLRRRLTARGRPPGSSVCAFDILVHLRPEAFSQGKFSSYYWQSLNGALAAGGVRTTWVHTFFRHPEVPTLRRAEQLVERFNANAPAGERHLVADGITPRVLATALLTYARLLVAAWSVRGIEAAFRPAGSGFDFWPLFRSAWWASMRGPTAVRNCLRIAQYEQLLAELPRQATGVYIQENQPWEMALLHAWRRAGHGRMIGMAHTTVRFWDLRYHYDPRTYVRRGSGELPRPDVVALNGPAAVSQYRSAGYPMSGVREVEALRYLHLRPRRRPRAATTGRVLICGDNIPGANDRLLRAVVAAAPLAGPATFVFKPHKAAPMDLSRYPLAFATSTHDLAELLEDCDIVVTGSTTSAAVDAYCAGVPVAAMFDGVTLNGSPLRGMSGVTWFHDAEGLAEAIRAVRGSVRPAGEQPFFYLDAGLPRWLRLLGVEPAVTKPADMATAASPPASVVRAYLNAGTMPPARTNSNAAEPSSSRKPRRKIRRGGSPRA